MTHPLPTVDVKGVCPHDCPDTCGWVVTVDTTTGKAVRMRGDADHPFTDGYLCQKVANYLERVYHPGRLSTPLRRVGRKGEGRFEPISWDEAVRTIAVRFRGIAAGEHGPQAILPYSYAGTMGKLHYASLDRRFFHRLGASLLDRTICATAGAVGCDITLGTRAVIDPATVTRSRYIVNWGSNTKVTNVHLWAIMLRAQKAGAKIVTIDPHRSKTAAASDWWIPVRPGTDAALALGVMHVLFRDGLQDQDFIDRFCLGGGELKSRVLAEYPPDKVAHITGLPVETIETFARELGTTKPAFIRLNYGMQRHGGGAMAVRTVACLPAITGDWRHPGGGAMLSTSKLYPFDDAFLTRPDLIPPGTRTINMTQLAEALHGELPGPPVQALYVYNSNPAAVCPDQSRVLEGLMRDDLFTVVHDQFQTDTADYADIVLPATTQLEHFDIHNSYGHLYVQVNRPAIKPLGESKPNTEVFRLLAKAMGFEDSLFAQSDEELARESLRSAECGVRNEDTTPHSVLRAPHSAFDGISFDHLLADGAVRLNVPTDWAPFASGHFPTPSGKCELYSPRELAAGRDPLPHYIPPHEDPQTKPELAAKYPLQLITPPTPSFLNSTFVNVDTLRTRAGEPRVEMHPVDAKARNILDGQTVRVKNDRGSLLAKAVVGESVQPGVVVSFGIWWNKYTPDGVNVNTVTSTNLTDQGGGATFYDNLVEVEKA
jgi:anaerobic selenocysteine-containing dehydrogenase